MLVWFGMMTGAASAQLLMRIKPEDAQTLRTMVLVNTGAYAGGLLALVFMGVMFWPLARLLGRRPRLTDIGRALGAYLIAHPFVFLTGWASTQIAKAIAGSTPNPVAHETLRALSDQPVGLWWVLAIVIALVAAPLLEEIMYRGLIQNGLLRLTRSPATSIGGASLIFALMHYSSVAPYALPMLFVLGLAFGIAYHRTRSLGVSIVMHATFNAVNLALVLLPF